jgi:hypothetical protein
MDASVALEHVYAGSSRPFDEATMRDLAGRDYDLTVNVASSQTNHFAMVDAGTP